MFSTVRWRLIWIGVLAIMCGWALVPKEVDDSGEAVWPINLGLDLQGGMHLAIEIDRDRADPDADFEDAIERTVTTLRNRIDQFGVREPNIQRAGDRVIVELAGEFDVERAVALVNQTAHMEFKIITDGQAFVDVLERIDRAIVNEVGADALTPTPLETAVDLSDVLGITPDSTPVDSTAAGGDQQAAADSTVADSTSGPDQAADQSADLRPLTSLLGIGRLPGEYLIAQQDTPNVKAWLEIPAVQDLYPRDITVNWGVEEVATAGNTYIPLYVLEAEPLITGLDLQDAGPANRDPTFNQPIVPFETTRQGARRFERGTQRNIGNNMAIVLDDKVQSYAVIRSVLGRRAQIELTPGTSFQEAQDLALVLRAGALPLPVRIVERRQVGASLGEDSIRQGRTAFIIGIVGVLVMMVAYYRLAGLIAVGALSFYVLFMLGGLAGLQANLTLPGIAGLILSIGMAVDANVLIFERIREEVDAGKTARTAVEAGFANALSAIVDANLTTLITGIILLQFGTGPVKGFAVTLCIGIMASFFSAVYVTRTFFMIYLDRRAASDTLSI